MSAAPGESVRRILRVLILIRVSTDEQAKNGTSLEHQLSLCMRRAKDLGATVVEVLVEDGISGGGYRTRPKLQAAIAAIEDGRADALICKDISRLSRKREYQSTIMSRVANAGGRIIFTDNDYADNAMGRFALHVTGDFADMQREYIREITTQGRRDKAALGVQPCRSKPPLGYHVVHRKDKEAGLYAEHPLGTTLIVAEEAATVRLVFQMCGDGATINSIARRLTREGYHSKFGGTIWRAGNIYKIITNPIYKGTAVFGRYRELHDEARLDKGLNKRVRRVNPEAEWITIPVPPLVDADLWERCQQRLEINRTAMAGRNDRKWMLSGLLRCPHCNVSMMGKHRKRRVGDKSYSYRYYECRYLRSPHLTPGGQGCPTKPINADWIEEQLLVQLRDLVERPAQLTDWFRSEQERAQRSYSPSTYDRLRVRVQELDTQEKVVFEGQLRAIAAGTSSTLYEDKLREINGARAALQAELAAMEGVRAEATRQDATQRATGIAAALRVCVESLASPETSPADKHAVLAQVIKGIVPNTAGPAKTFRVVFREPAARV